MTPKKIILNVNIPIRRMTAGTILEVISEGESGAIVADSPASDEDRDEGVIWLMPGEYNQIDGDNGYISICQYPIDQDKEMSRSSFQFSRYNRLSCLGKLEHLTAIEPASMQDAIKLQAWINRWIEAHKND
jgi:hypothetical protein